MDVDKNGIINKEELIEIFKKNNNLDEQEMRIQVD